MRLSMRFGGFGLCAGLFLLLATLGSARAQSRVALVLGNGDYLAAPKLLDAANDAQDVAAALRKLGFEVIEQHDAGRAAMVKALHDFSDRLPGAQLSLFFYAGHAVQMNGANYLVPVDADVRNPADARFGTIRLSDVEEEMAAGNRASIAVLDASRDNPFVPALARLAAEPSHPSTAPGLASVDAPPVNSLVVFSSRPNTTVTDNPGRDSLFTGALLRNATTPGLEVREMLSRVRDDLASATGGRQAPWSASTLTGEVYLAGAPTGPGSRTSDMTTGATIGLLPSDTTQAPAAGGASDADADECDLRAAPRAPRTSAADVHERLPLDWSRALAVCQSALRAHPGETKFIYEVGRAQNGLHNYIEALRDFRAAADTGDVNASIDVGLLYYFGHGVIQNYLMAYEYFNKASQTGSARATGILASMFGTGSGVARDDVKSLELAEKAAAGGNPFGLWVIGNHYFNTHEYPLAGQYYQQAADLGDGQSMKALANLYEGGYLGKPDPQKAAELRLRAEKYDPGSADPSPAHLPMFRPVAAGGSTIVAPNGRRPTPANGGYNPAWQAAPGDTSCCPNNLLVCPLGRHFCGH